MIDNNDKSLDKTVDWEELEETFKADLSDEQVKEILKDDEPEILKQILGDYEDKKLKPRLATDKQSAFYDQISKEAYESIRALDQLAQASDSDMPEDDFNRLVKEISQREQAIKTLSGNSGSTAQYELAASALIKSDKFIKEYFSDEKQPVNINEDDSLKRTIEEDSNSPHKVTPPQKKLKKSFSFDSLDLDAYDSLNMAINTSLLEEPITDYMSVGIEQIETQTDTKEKNDASGQTRAGSTKPEKVKQTAKTPEETQVKLKNNSSNSSIAQSVRTRRRHRHEPSESIAENVINRRRQSSEEKSKN